MFTTSCTPLLRFQICIIIKDRNFCQTCAKRRSELKSTAIMFLITMVFFLEKDPVDIFQIYQIYWLIYMPHNVKTLVMFLLSQLKAASFSFSYNQLLLLDFIWDLNNCSRTLHLNKRMKALHVSVSRGEILKTLCISFDPVLRVFFQ